MNTLLIFFAFPLAVIIFSIVLQKQLNSPISVAALNFATFIVITFAFFDVNFLIVTFVYTLISFITAIIFSNFICQKSIDNTNKYIEEFNDYINEKNINQIKNDYNDYNIANENDSINYKANCNMRKRFR